MSKPVDLVKRNFLKFSLLGSILLLANRLFAVNKVTPQAQGDNEILAVRFWPSDIYTRIAFESKYPIKSKYFHLANPNRFVIDLLGIKINDILLSLNKMSLANSPLVKNIRVGQFASDIVRVVVEVNVPVYAKTTLLKPVDLAGVSYHDRYVFDIYPKLNDDSKSISQTILDLDSLSALINQDKTQKNKHGKPKSNNQNVTQNVESRTDAVVMASPAVNKTKGKKNYLVMIDPGHGGEDPGAVGPTNLKEKDVVLDISKRLYALINSSPNYKAKLTRSQDIFIPLGSRVKMARQADADLFLSIHADAAPSRQAHGTSVFMLSDKGATNSFARWLAKTQNDSDLIGGVSASTANPTVNKVLLEMTQTYTLNQSAAFGESVLAKLKTINKLHSNTVEKAAFAVLKAPDIPSILVETAFISNEKEEDLLKTPEYRQLVAENIFIGIQEYVNKNN